jgi:hypothetical protein
MKWHWLLVALALGACSKNLDQLRATKRSFEDRDRTGQRPHAA